MRATSGRTERHRARLGRVAGRQRGAPSRERGVTLVVVAIMLVVLIGFAALVIDIGKLYKTRSELQNAADSAALAGASGLRGDAAGIEEARVRAKDFAELHLADLTDVDLDDADIVFGDWDDTTQTFTPLGSEPGDPAMVDAIRVITRREAGTGNAVVFHLARVLGMNDGDVRADAIAISGGPRAECGFPMVVADCSLRAALEDGTCGHCMTYQDANTDTAGWTSFDEGSVGGPTITDLIGGACLDAAGNVAIDPVTGECQGACNQVYAGTDIKVQNGNLLNQGLQNFCPLIQTLLRRGVPGGVPQPFTVRVPVLASPVGGTCDGTQFSSWHQVAGFAAFDILGAKCGNADPGVFVSGSPCAPPSSGKYVVGSLRCDLESVDPPGGGWYGIRSLHPRLVE